MPKFEDAVRESIRKYFDGHGLTEYKKAVGSRKHKFTKDYFDSAEKEFGLRQDDDEMEGPEHERSESPSFEMSEDD